MLIKFLLNNIQRIQFLIILASTIGFTVYINLDRILLYPIADEWYYLYPTTFKNIMDWPNYSFGHPPLFNILTLIYYSFFKDILWGFHLLSLFISLFLIYSILHYFHKASSNLIGLLTILLLLNTDYFILHSASAHPLILGAIFLFLIIKDSHTKSTYKITVFANLAFLTRESLLSIFPFLLIKRGPRKNFYFIPHITIIGLVYGYYYLKKQSLMLNSQVEYLIGENVPFMTFTVNHFFDFLKSFSLEYNNPLIMFYAMTTIYITSIKKKSIFALLSAFSCHFIFFAFYSEHSYRDTFFPSFYIIILISLCLVSVKPKFKNIKTLLIITMIIQSLFSLKNKTQKSLYFANLQNFNHKSTLEIVKIIKRTKVKSIISPFNINTKLSSKHVGYHDPGKVRYYDISDYHFKYIRKKNPDMLITTKHSNELTKKLKKVINFNNYILIKEFIGKEQAIKVYIYNKLEIENE